MLYTLSKECLLDFLWGRKSRQLSLGACGLVDEGTSQRMTLSACDIITLIRVTESMFEGWEDMGNPHGECCLRVGFMGGLPREIRPSIWEGVETPWENGARETDFGVWKYGVQTWCWKNLAMWMRGDRAGSGLLVCLSVVPMHPWFSRDSHPFYFYSPDKTVGKIVSEGRHWNLCLSCFWSTSSRAVFLKLEYQNHLQDFWAPSSTVSESADPRWHPQWEPLPLGLFGWYFHKQPV